MKNILFILGLGLAGRIQSLKNKYRGNKRLFDHSRIFIRISEYKGKYSYSAMSNCNDVSMQGLGNSPFISIYERNGFKSQIETESSIEKQVRFASKKLIDTNFYLYKPIEYYENGKLIENVWADYEYEDGKWNQVFNLEPNPLCKSCGKEIEVDLTICPSCGELIV